MRHIFKNGIDYLSSRWCSKGDPCFCSHPRLSVQRRPGGLVAPTLRHHLRMIRVQSSLTTWILYCILIPVLSNFSKVETLTSDKIKFTKAGSTWSETQHSVLLVIRKAGLREGSLGNSEGEGNGSSHMWNLVTEAGRKDLASLCLRLHTLHGHCISFSRKHHCSCASQRQVCRGEPRSCDIWM